MCVCKNCGTKLVAKEGLPLDEREVDLNSVKVDLNPEVGQLSTLKPLSISNMSDDLGINPCFSNPIVALSPSVPFTNLALRDLGFLSPCKVSPIVSKGYFLRSCSKSVNEGFRPIKDTLGNLKSVRGLIGDVSKDLHSVMNGAGALREIAPNKVPL